MIIEGNAAVRHIDMAPGKPFGRNDPFCIETCEGRRLQKYTCQDVTGPVPKENPVGKRPSALRIALDAGFQLIDGAAPRLPSWMVP